MLDLVSRAASLLQTLGGGVVAVFVDCGDEEVEIFFGVKGSTQRCVGLLCVVLLLSGCGGCMLS